MKNSRKSVGFKPGAFVSLVPAKISIKTKIFEFLEPIPVSLCDSG